MISVFRKRIFLYLVIPAVLFGLSFLFLVISVMSYDKVSESLKTADEKFRLSKTTANQIEEDNENLIIDNTPNTKEVVSVLNNYLKQVFEGAASANGQITSDLASKKINSTLAGVFSIQAGNHEGKATIEYQNNDVVFHVFNANMAKGFGTVNYKVNNRNQSIDMYIEMTKTNNSYIITSLNTFNEVSRND